MSAIDWEKYAQELYFVISQQVSNGPDFRNSLLARMPDSSAAWPRALIWWRGGMVVALKESWSELAGLELVAVLPFEGHDYSSEPWRTLHQMVLNSAREVVTLASKYRSQAYHDRNRYMVDHSSRLICYRLRRRSRPAQTVV